MTGKNKQTKPYFFYFFFKSPTKTPRQNSPTKTPVTGEEKKIDPQKRHWLDKKQMKKQNKNHINADDREKQNNNNNKNLTHINFADQ